MRPTRIREIKMKKIKMILSFILIVLSILLIGCYKENESQGLSGTYVPKNEVARLSHYQKFEFRGGKVKLYYGISGAEISHDLSYSLIGNTLEINVASQGYVYFTYDRAKDEISLVTAVWYKEGPKK